MLRNVFSGCVSDRSSQAEVLQCQKLKFGASLSSALKNGFLPGPLVDILVYITKEGVATSDVFRRPGNPNDTRRIVKRLTEGKQVIYSNYSFYTLASVVKKFLLKIPGGVFTPEGEEQLLQVLTLQQKMEQIESVHHFIESLTPAHQQLVALLFGAWFRIVAFCAVNSMSVEALSRSVAGSMFHTCAEDPAKVEKASRIMQFLIENYAEENMFGRENIQFFVETTHTGLQVPANYCHYACRPPSSFIPTAQPDVIEVTRMEEEEKMEEERHDFLGRERHFSSQSPQLSPSLHPSDFSHDPCDPNDSQLLINMSTLSAPEVSLMPSPEVSKRPKSLEDNLNEVRSSYQSRCLSRFNSVKRKQLERLRQRSDWFLSPTTRESRNNSRKGRDGLSIYSSSNHPGNHCKGGSEGNSNDNRYSNTGSKSHYGSSKKSPESSCHPSVHHQCPGGGFPKASSEGAVIDAFSDRDSVFTDNTSRSESPASEPVWSHILKAHSRDLIHSDTVGHLTLPEASLDGGSSGFDLSMGSQEVLDCSGALSDVDHVPIEHGMDSEMVSGDGDEEENVTPTGTQEEVRGSPGLMSSSLMDIGQPSPGEDSGSSWKGDDSDKDSPSTLCGEECDRLGTPDAVTASNLSSPEEVSCTLTVSGDIPVSSESVVGGVTGMEEKGQVQSLVLGEGDRCGDIPES